MTLRPQLCEQRQGRPTGNDTTGRLEHRRAKRNDAERKQRTVEKVHPPSASSELITISPRSKFGSLRFPDANEFETFRQSGEADLVGRNTLARIAIQSLAGFDRLPSLFQWRQIPLRAPAADDPQAAKSLIEGQPPAYRERFNDLVRAE